MDLQDGWGYTALMDACIGGHVASASVLPEAGANKDLTDILGNTALISACDRICLPGRSCGCWREPGLAPRRRTTATTQLSSAHAIEATLTLHICLWKFGANKDVSNISGNTSLICASGRGGRGHVEVARMLLERGADMVVANSSGSTALIC